MNVHEYQAKALLESFGVAVPAGGSRRRPPRPRRRPAHRDPGGRREGAGARGRPRQGRRHQAREVAQRGEAARERDPRHDARHAPDRPEGKLVRKVYVEAGCEIARELYLALALDRATEASR